MKVYVVVAVHSGCIQDVDVFQNKEDAERIAQTVKDEWGIVSGHEAESEHDVQVYERLVM